MKAETLGDFEAIQDRKHHVEQDDVEGMQFGLAKARAPVMADFDDATFVFEALPDEAGEFLVVLDQEDVQCGFEGVTHFHPAFDDWPGLLEPIMGCEVAGRRPDAT